MQFEATFIGRYNTVKTYKSLFRNWIKSSVKVNTTKNELNLLVGSWQACGLKPRTIKMLLSLSGRYIHFLGGPHINTTEIVRVVLQSKQSKPIKALKTQEAQTLLNTCQDLDPNLYFPILLALHTGMRRGEVFGLEWGDVDHLTGNITVQRSYDGPTKNGQSRVVPISSPLEKILLAQMPLNSDNCIGKGKIIEQFDPTPRLKIICKAANVPIITFHGLRHTFATLALESGISPKIVQEALGHSNVSTTLNLYWDRTREQIDLGFISSIS